MLFPVSSTGGPHRALLYVGFITPYKKKAIREYHFEEQKNKGRKPDKNSSLGRIKFMPRNLD
jgi:hypothetical protein